MVSKPHKTARLSASMHPAQLTLLREGKATERDEHHCQRLQSELWVRISVYVQRLVEFSPQEIQFGRKLRKANSTYS